VSSRTGVYEHCDNFKFTCLLSEEYVLETNTSEIELNLFGEVVLGARGSIFGSGRILLA
jgi:hypothetical protein